jgi:outer membrane protein assembly factor BamA
MKTKYVHMPFTAQLVEDQRKIITDYINKLGFRNVNVKTDIKRTDNNVHLAWNINLGSTHATFGKTIIKGDTKIPFECIQRELAYKEGDPWSSDAIKETFLRLKRWDVFENIHLVPDQSVTQDKEKTVILKLQEDDPYELRLRGGLEIQQVAQLYVPEGLTYTLGGSFILKSPFHRGDQLRIDGDFARVYRELAAQYQIPWIFNQPIKTLCMVYSNKYLQPGFVGGEKSIYDSVSQGFLAGFTRKFDHVDIGTNIGFEWLKTSIPDRSSAMLGYIEGVSRAINFDPQLFNRSVPFFQLEPTIMIDYVDQKIDPRSGSFTLMSLKAMVPVVRRELDAYFVKALAEQSWFFPIKSCVLATRLRLGHIFFHTIRSVMPMERFYLGGANSLRSYDTDFAPPLGSFVDTYGKRQYVPQGGQSMVNANVELRFPIYQRLGGVLFQDIGALSSTKFADITYKDVLLGTGFGVRVATPVGPLRFDIGWKWAREPRARSFAWFLSFGQAF